jgi:hypothetical protein
MRFRVTGVCGFVICWLLAGQVLHAQSSDFVPLAERTARLLDELRSERLVAADRPDERRVPGVGLHIRNCRAYPYNETANLAAGADTLLSDLAAGLATGLQCLSGDGPMGRLHPYHEHQAHRLLGLLEARTAKTFQCVEDAMFATAVATSPRGVSIDDPLYDQLRRVRHPAVLLDTYRLGGILSRRHDDETYRAFFHLADDQIFEHRNGQPLRPANLHRYRDRAGLLFHEVVHWLGHEHSAGRPDLTHLYETCCFGGSDYIDDPARNAAHQQTACAILKDDELWSEAYNPYRQMRLWHHKGYDRFKAQMRADYDS